jgi:trehalose 6-phosphate synthase/phosphatase
MSANRESKPPTHAAGDLPPIYEAESTSLSPQTGLTKDEPEGESDSSPNLPPHQRTAVTRVPVTPGIHQNTYQTPSLQRSGTIESGGYFTQNPAKHDRTSVSMGAAQTGGDDSAARRSSSPNDLIQGSMSGEEVLRRMSYAATGRKESISDIRSAAPDLALSGNIISATFTTPHTLKYHKNGEWVRHETSSSLLNSWAKVK